jgi:hypothetical protein
MRSGLKPTGLISFCLYLSRGGGADRLKAKAAAKDKAERSPAFGEKNMTVSLSVQQVLCIPFPSNLTRRLLCIFPTVDDGLNTRLPVSGAGSPNF